LCGDLANLFARGQKCVDKAAFSRFYLARNDKKEGFVNPLPQFADRFGEFGVANIGCQLVQIADEGIYFGAVRLDFRRNEIHIFLCFFTILGQK
jgi:hypothetical protein